MSVSEPLHLQQIQHGIDFVEDHLDVGFELREVSAAAAASHCHSQRMFKAATGETLGTYVRSRRMANALDRLLKTDDRVIDIAIGAGFESHEAFTRAFKRQFGMTPNDYRRVGDRSLFLAKAAIDADYLRHLERGVSVEPVLEHRAATRLVGLRTEFYGVDSERNNLGERLPGLWDEFLDRVPEIAGRVGPNLYGVVQPVGRHEERLVYHAAAEVGPAASFVDIPAGMSEVEVPAADYAVFAHRGPAGDVDHTVNYAYSTWLLGSGRRHTYGPDLEIYGPGFHPTEPDSVFHYAIPVA